MTRAELAAPWLPVMADFPRRNWDQWFVFEKEVLFEAATGAG